MKSRRHLKGYANDVEKERVNVESLRSFLKLDLNRFLGCNNQMFMHEKYPKNKRVDSKLTLSFSTS